MKLGLITDIHEQVELLRSTLEVLRERQVEQIVVIGDVFEMGERIEETCELLREAQCVGVWGNHDFGLSCKPARRLRRKYGNGVVDFMSSLHPRLEIESCLFQHVEPWLDAKNVMDLWYFDGMPDTSEKIGRIFRAVPNRITFAGHYHRWLAVTPKGIVDWSGEQPLSLSGPDRYFVVIGALCEGRFAIFDTNTSVLIPFTQDLGRETEDGAN